MLNIHSHQVQRARASFDSDTDGYLSREFTTGDRQIWSVSCFFKLNTLPSSPYRVTLFANTDTTAAVYGDLYLAFSPTSTNPLNTVNVVANSNINNFSASGLGIDLGDWFHLLVAVDTTQATAADRVKVWLNGSSVSAGLTNIVQNDNTNIGINGDDHTINRIAVGTDVEDLSLAYFQYIDGTAVDIADVVYVSAGSLYPKKYRGAFGTNGCLLLFNDSSSLGDDTSGNSNDWTTNGTPLRRVTDIPPVSF